MARKVSSFRVGRVRADLRGKVWYLTYHEGGQRHRPRVGPSRELARQMAAQINSQLEVGAPAALSFEPIAIAELQHRWLEHHEHVLRSSVQTIRRYRSATAHLLTFLQSSRSPATTDLFRSQHAAEFVCYLRTVQVAPNGHQNARKRQLVDKGLKYVLLICRWMFNFALKHRHLSPYAENPFALIAFRLRILARCRSSRPIRSGSSSRCVTAGSSRFSSHSRSLDCARASSRICCCLTTSTWNPGRCGFATSYSSAGRSRPAMSVKNR